MWKASFGFPYPYSQLHVCVFLSNSVIKLAALPVEAICKLAVGDVFSALSKVSYLN